MKFVNSIAGIAALVAWTGAQAGTIVVTNTNDSGPGSLRDATRNNFPGDVVVFSLPFPATIKLTSGELILGNDITISGPGPANLTIDGNFNRRVFATDVGKATVTGLTIANGRAGDLPSDLPWGGGILNLDTLVVSNCIITGNAAIGTNGIGGAIYNADTSGKLTVVNSIIRSNFATTFGGGIANNASSGANGGTASATVRDCLITHNFTGTNGYGGAIYNFAHAFGTGTVAIINSTIRSNSASYGGGIANRGGDNGIAALTVSNSIVSYNRAIYTNSSRGGGIYNECIINSSTPVTVIGSALTRNSAGDSGGGIYYSARAFPSSNFFQVFNSTVSSNSAKYGGGIYNVGDFFGPEMILSNSTVSGNTALVGAGLSNDGAQFGRVRTTILNSTVSGNSATTSAGAIYNNGGSNGNAILIIFNSTFSGNTASFTAGIDNNGFNGFAQLSLGSSIFNGVETLWTSSGTVSSSGYNLASDEGGNVLFNPTDQIHTDPMLGPLANNGGPTMTHALMPGSPAIDRGKRFGQTTDQRGQARPHDFASIANAADGDGSDIGAFEVEAAPRLNLQALGGNAVLTWPLYHGGYTLQSTTNISAPNSWIIASGSAAPVGNQYQQNNGAISSNRFFRLRN